MKNKTLVFAKKNNPQYRMEQKVGDSYPIDEDIMIKLMDKAGWVLVFVKG